MSYLKENEFTRLAKELRMDLELAGLTNRVKIIGRTNRISIYGGAGCMITQPVIHRVLSFAEKNDLLFFIDCDNPSLVLHR